MGEGVNRYKRGDRVRLKRAGPHRDAGDVGVVQETGYRVVLVRFDRLDRSGAKIGLVDRDDLERIEKDA